MGKRRRKAKKNDRLMSLTDPDAEPVSRGGSSSLPACKAYFCVDRRRRVILSIDGSKATEDDLTKVDTLFTESMFAVGKKPHTVVADSHYGGIEDLKYFQDQNIQTCINPRIHDNSEGRFRNTDFKMIVNGQEMECPAGHRVQKPNEQPVSDPISLAEAAVQRMCSQEAVHTISPWEDCQPL